MNNDIFQEYAILESKIKDLEKTKEDLRATISEMVMKTPEKKIPTDFGNFSLSFRKKWTYPAIVAELEESVKVAKAKAESSKTATYVETPTLSFTSIKL
jgi:gentisate 1,2-dioxygenase